MGLLKQEYQKFFNGVSRAGVNPLSYEAWLESEVTRLRRNGQYFVEQFESTATHMRTSIVNPTEGTS